MYDHLNPPPVIPGSEGHLRPKPEGTTAACVAPVGIDWPYPENWGQPEGATMHVPAGGWITCLGPKDSYYNDEFLATCSLTGQVLDPEHDERAAELTDHWLRTHELVVLVVEAKKTVGAIVVGEVANEAVGQELMTAEGPAVLAKHDLVLRSPRRSDRIFRITPANRKKRYLDDGRVFAGDLPPEFC